MSQYGNPMFFQILEELRALHTKKGQDYGTASDPLANVRASVDWGVPGWVGTLIRANDKVIRFYPTDLFYLLLKNHLLLPDFHFQNRC